MIGRWITHVHNRVFIGFGPYIECSHCHNKGWLHIWQPYFQQWAYSIIPAHPKMYGEFTVVCNICHWGFKIKKKEKAKVAELLDQGKTSTKYGFDRMDAKAKEQLLKHLNRNGFTQIAAYVSFGDQVIGAPSQRTG
jgi:hypothetical protein